MVFFSSPRNQLQAHHANGFPVLLSFAVCSPWIEKGYSSSFSHLLIDSGSYSEMASGFTLDPVAYFEWADRFPSACAVAGCDSIDGDWRLSLERYKLGGFPTFHSTDPEGLLPDLLDISRERGWWIGIGVKPNPTRAGFGAWIARTLDRIPEGFHVHGWALCEYSYLSRFDSFDSTAWWRNALSIRAKLGDWCSYSEALELSIKKLIREPKAVRGSDCQGRLDLA